ncbi:hypothetical protein D3C72_2179150 [compost metagenome]
MRGLLKAGDQPDLERASRTFLHDLRSGGLGLVTIDPPPDASAADVEVISVEELGEDAP